jgi:hypothetical protein
MAVDIFIKIDAFDGEAQDTKDKKEIDLLPRSQSRNGDPDGLGYRGERKQLAGSSDRFVGRLKRSNQSSCRKIRDASL